LFEIAQFTGKERDTETGLDYFGARYYGSNVGRWMSPDWSDAPEPVPYADLTDPQSLNLYGYVRNNPLSHADADGHCATVWECVVAPVVTGVSWAASGAAAGAGLLITLGAEMIKDPTGTNFAAAPPGGMGMMNADGMLPEVHRAMNAENAQGVDSKNVPNPNGSKGAPDHQQTADEEAAKMGPNGQREVRVGTPGGEKGSRVIDAAKVENGKVTQATQVIRPNKNGTPPAREVRAAADIQKATGVKPKLVPVRPIKKPDGQ
jgi:RHS repeat-associated protein